MMKKGQEGTKKEEKKIEENGKKNSSETASYLDHTQPNFVARRLNESLSERYYVKNCNP
jgi:hypothetical protein